MNPSIYIYIYIYIYSTSQWKMRKKKKKTIEKYKKSEKKKKNKGTKKKWTKLMCKCTWTFSLAQQIEFFPLVFSPFWKENTWLHHFFFLLPSSSTQPSCWIELPKSAFCYIMKWELPNTYKAKAFRGMLMSKGYMPNQQ